MSKLGNWENKLDVAKLENMFVRKGLNRHFAFQGEEYFMQLRTEGDYLLAFNSCPPLKAIVSKRANLFNTGNLEVLNKNTGNYAVGSVAKSIKNILDKPNALQTGKQFFAQQNIYCDLFGYCPILVMRPAGMPEEITAIWNIPPWLFDLTYTGDWLYQTQVEGVYKKFFMFWGNKKIELEPENLFFIFDNGIGTEDDSNLTIPDSRLVGNEYVVSNITAAYKSRNTLITKRGAIGILSNDSRDQAGILPLKAGQKEEVQKDFSKYGLTGQPFQIIITDAALKWQNMGYPTKDLMLFEEIEDDINRLCDAYGWPPQLIARTKDVTFDNKKEGMKEAYRDTIIPESKQRMEQFSAAIIPEGLNLVITRDYSEVEVLQEDRKHQAEARRALNEALKIEYYAGLITKNDWLEALGMDRRTDPGFDDYYAPTITNPKPDEEDTPSENPSPQA